jgi:trk system potassium uptake protein TrkH
MNYRFVIFTIGKLLQVLAVVLLIPAAIAVSECLPCSMKELLFDIKFFGFFITIIVSSVTGTILLLIKVERRLRGNAVREGFTIVTFGWIILALFGSIPLFIYFLSTAPSHGIISIFHCFTDAYFEIMSGFTTTGATILTDVEVLPRGILFWRSMTHWLGGMGIVTLALSIFPAFGVTAYQMFRGEVPGPTTERLRPSLNQTATILWGVYVLLTFFEAFLLYFGGMSIFEAFCHAFGTMATGGFSTRNGSIGAYNSVYIDWVIIFFMMFAGMNFILHYQVIFHRKFSVLRQNSEFKFFISIILIAIAIATITLQIEGLGSEEDISRSFRNEQLSESELSERMAVEKDKVSSIFGAIRRSAFQVLSITTTTGFCTADFDMWPNVLRIMLVVLMFFGGCAGSTGGGIKMVRIMIIMKTAWREVKTMIQPRLILPIKIAKKALEEKQVANILGFFTLFITLFIVFTGIMSLIVSDFTTAITTVAATICNIGPGLSGIGATENYAWIPVIGKWVLALSMLMGRLEVYTVIVAFSPIAWRK